MSLKFDLTVAAIAERAGRFLCVQERAARRVVLNQPAGHLENGESLIEAVIRETREELRSRGGELRSPLVLLCIEDYLRGIRYPLDLLNHAATD